MNRSQIREGLARVAACGAFDDVPNEWQIGLGILRMWHRILFRSDTIGTSATPVRKTRRARWLAHRAVRFPFLVAEGAIVPLDTSGLRTSGDRLIRHLLAAHHDQNQFVYDLQLLRIHPGALDRLITAVSAVVDGTDSRADWLRDLVVHEGYHEALLAAALAERAGTDTLSLSDRDNPDITFTAFLAWCCRQPPNPGFFPLRRRSRKDMRTKSFGET